MSSDPCARCKILDAGGVMIVEVDEMVFSHLLFFIPKRSLDSGLCDEGVCFFE